MLPPRLVAEEKKHAHSATTRAIPRHLPPARVFSRALISLHSRCPDRSDSIEEMVLPNIEKPGSSWNHFRRALSDRETPARLENPSSRHVAGLSGNAQNLPPLDPTRAIRSNLGVRDVWNLSIRFRDRGLTGRVFRRSTALIGNS